MILTIEFYNGDRESLVELEVHVFAHKELDDVIIDDFSVLSVTETMSDGTLIDLKGKVPKWISYSDIMTEIEYSDWGD